MGRIFYFSSVEFNGIDIGMLCMKILEYIIYQVRKFLVDSRQEKKRLNHCI